MGLVSKSPVSVLVASMRPFNASSDVWPLLLERDQARECVISVVVSGEGELEILRAAIPGAVCVPRGFQGFGVDYGLLGTHEFNILSQMMLGENFTPLKRQVIAMLNRHDSTGGFRLVDREMIFYELFYSLGGLVIRKAVSHVFFDITPHVVTEYILFWFAKNLGLKVLFLQPIPVAGLSIARTDVDLRLLNAKEVANSQAAMNFRESARSQLEEFAEKLRGGNATWVKRYLGPEMRKVDKKSFQPLKKLSRFLSLSQAPNSAGLPGMTTLPMRAARLLESLLIWGHRASFLASRKENASDMLPNEPFLLYAMTHEPERTFFPEALPWESQFEFISHLAASQAGSRKIVVKEHETQYAPGRLGYASRSNHFYRLIQTLPNVTLVSSQLSAQKILPAADGVVSATGTICVEAALMGKSGFYFGNPWWEGFPGTSRITAEDLRNGILREAPAYTGQKFDQWVEGLLETAVSSTSNVSNEVFSSKYAALPEGYRELEANSLGALLDRFLFEKTGETA